MAKSLCRGAKKFQERLSERHRADKTAIEIQRETTGRTGQRIQIGIEMNRRTDRQTDRETDKK